MQLLQILLSATDAATSSFPWGRLFDTGLTLGILAVIVKVLWEKLKKLEAKLDSYIAEDRAEMLETINKNTEAMRDHTEATRRLNEHLERQAN